MAQQSYLDLDVFLEQSRDGYRARLSQAVAGQAVTNFGLGALEAPLADFLARMGRSRRGGGGAETDIDTVKQFGAQLFDVLFGVEARGCLRSSLEEARRQGSGLRLRVRLSPETTELADVPWEYIYHSTLNRFLALSNETPLVRYLEMTERIQPLTVETPLRVLVMISSPLDSPPLDVDHEWLTLKEALEELTTRKLVILERLEFATLPTLQRQLRRKEYHVFHFIGHGSFDPDTQDGYLFLEDQEQMSRPMSGRDLGVLLHDHRTLRLAILNACEGARAARADPFAGTAQSLVQQGLPAVIAMQFEISDEAAISMAREFYGALADGYPVDAALAEARKAIYAVGNETEWGTPVLYMRAPDGRIFDIAQISPAEQLARQIAALWLEAQSALAIETWDDAVEKLQAILRLDPTHGEASNRLAHAKQQQELVAAYAKGREYYDEGRWREALDSFRRVQELGGNYKGVFGLIATVQHELNKSVPAPAAPLPGGGVSLARGVGVRPGVGGVARRRVDPLEPHYRQVLKAITDGRLVPFLGGNINICGRPPGVAWQPGQYLPSGEELAEYLAEIFGYPGVNPMNLVRVSQYISVTSGPWALYDELRALFAMDYPPTPVHQFFAGLPGILRAKGYPVRPPLIVTTNYDDVLEETFRTAGEPYDLVFYVAEGETRGKFWHLPPDGEARVIDRPNEYRGLAPDQRAVILKFQGAVDRIDQSRDSFVITEDHFIDYLTSSDMANLIPVTLVARLRSTSQLLFLGHTLRDWNLRVILHRVWGDQKLSAKYKAWAIQIAPDQLDQEFWRGRDVELISTQLETYVAALSERLEELPPV